MPSGNNFIDSIMESIMNVILFVCKTIMSIVLSHELVTIIFGIVVVNLIAIFLMKKDKQYAKEGKRRIRELTLLIVALAGGALGMYYAMYKYKHKTLHKKFTILVPLFIVLHFACISYMLVNSFLV